MALPEMFTSGDSGQELHVDHVNESDPTVLWTAAGKIAAWLLYIGGDG